MLPVLLLQGGGWQFVAEIFSGQFWPGSLSNIYRVLCGKNSHNLEQLTLYGPVVTNI